jgi:hypothetical protein
LLSYGENLCNEELEQQDVLKKGDRLKLILTEISSATATLTGTTTSQLRGMFTIASIATKKFSEKRRNKHDDQLWMSHIVTQLE